MKKPTDFKEAYRLRAETIGRDARLAMAADTIGAAHWLLWKAVCGELTMDEAGDHLSRNATFAECCLAVEAAKDVVNREQEKGEKA